MNITRYSRKRVRGHKRKSKNLLKNIAMYTESFPEADIERGYWHMHLPCAVDFIDSTHTPRTTRKLCIQALVDGAKHLPEIRPQSDSNARVAAAIYLPNLSNSQIIVFFDAEYFDAFFNRDEPTQKWTLMPDHRNIAKEYNLIIPDGFDIKGYREELNDEGYKSLNEIWFIGELKN